MDVHTANTLSQTKMEPWKTQFIYKQQTVTIQKYI